MPDHKCEYGMTCYSDDRCERHAAEAESFAAGEASERRTTDLEAFRAFLDRFWIDYHVETHAGPNGSPITGAACSIEHGGHEYAFDASGRFLGWCDFSDGPAEVHLHPLRGGSGTC